MQFHIHVREPYIFRIYSSSYYIHLLHGSIKHMNFQCNFHILQQATHALHFSNYINVTSQMKCSYNHWTKPNQLCNISTEHFNPVTPQRCKWTFHTSLQVSFLISHRKNEPGWICEYKNLLTCISNEQGIALFATWYTFLAKENFA
jgi:hypothetical protein